MDSLSAGSPVNFANHLCFRSGDWIPYHELTVAVQDVGFRQGVIAVERLRTYNTRPFQVARHLDRWNQTTTVLGIAAVPDAGQIENLLAELLSHNESFVAQQSDVGITLFATPGIAGSASPTFALHLNPLDHASIERHRHRGQPLVVTEFQQPSEKCWPRSIKVRSRIHYYLADQAARQHDPDAIGILLDTDGSITETSVANLAIVQSGQIESAPIDAVLGGVTQGVTESIAKQMGIRWRYRPIEPQELAIADEILLMGTDGGIWFGCSVDQQPVGDGAPGPLFTALRSEFDAVIGKP